jgi:hypothetical protein
VAVVDAATGLRRVAGKLVLFLAGCWLLVLIAGVAGAFRGAKIEPLNFAIMLVPGCALVPAAYFTIGMLRSTDPERVRQLWPKVVVYALAGLVLLFGTAYGLYEMGRS